MSDLKENKRIKEKNYNSFKGVLSIINMHFWKAFVGPFFAFGYPIVFVIVLGTIFSYEMVLGSSITIGPLAIACISLPTAIFEFKKSTLLKRIGASSIKPLAFLSYTAIYYFVIMFLSGLWTSLVSLVVFGSRYFYEGRVVYELSISTYTQGPVLDSVKIRISSMFDMFKRIEWIGYIYSFLVLTLVSIAVGLTVVSFSKSILMIQMLGSSLLIFTMFLTGQVLPLAQIAGVKTMWWLSYITPFKSPIVQNTMAFQGGAKLSQIYYGSLESNPQTSTLYDGADFRHYLAQVTKYGQLKYMNPTNDYIQKNSQDFIQGISTFSGNVSIDHNSYNIFNINDVYKSVNLLNAFEPVVIKTDDFLKSIVSDAAYELNKGDDSKFYFLKFLANDSNALDSYLNDLKTLDHNNSAMINQNIENIFENIKHNLHINKILNTFVKLNEGRLTDDSIVTIGSKIENVINFILPYVWTASLLLLSKRFFTWNAR